MAIVPKKNISKHLHDIKHASVLIKEKKEKKFNFPENFYKKNSLAKTKSNKKIKPLVKYGLVLSIAIVMIGGSIFASNIKNNVLNSFAYIVYQIQNIRSAASEMKTEQLKDSLGALNTELQALSSKSENYGVTGLLNIIGQFNGSLKEIPGAFKSISAISDRSNQIASDLDYLKNNAFQLIFNQRGEELISRLENMQKNLTDLEKIMPEFKNQAIKIKDLSPTLSALYNIFDKNYLSINLNIYKSEDVINALLSLLKSPNEVNVLILFQNPTEIRPGGGFLGSFAYVTLLNGSIKEIKVDDIYNADRQLNVNVAPPKELSSITPVWGARDANWFFNFPDSAQKVSYFLENSKLFSDSGIKFDNVISINTNVLASLIDIVGPITLPNYGLTINSDNFLPELQHEIEAGQDKKPGQNPKRILSVLTPILIDKLKGLDDNGKIDLLKDLSMAVSNKDIMAFSKTDDIQKIFLEFNLAGEVFNIPQNWNGDYLAIANANVAGGKSDAFINQNVSLKSQILEDGSITNNLTLTRTHTGQKEKDWWYRATNYDYIKIFTPPSTEINVVTGNNSSHYRYVPPSKKLSIDPDLAAIDQSTVFLNDLKIWEGIEDGKEFFGTWMDTPAGKTNWHPLPPIPVLLSY
ncbi:MAG: DUF4012 domain-containing protein [Patescibacteria group bacterium]|nr:DUF4012 domain-containing protein [Patescibacteria group bacterium]